MILNEYDLVTSRNGLSLKELITHYKSDEEIITFLNWIWDKTKVKCIKFIN